MRRVIAKKGVGLLAAIWLGAATVAADALKVVVTSTADAGGGTLREAIGILNEQGDGEIDLRLVHGTIEIESRLPDVRRNVRFIGPDSQTGRLHISGGGKVPIFSFAEGSTSEVVRLVLTNGLATGPRHGAAISNAGTLRMRECEISGNRNLGGWGGGLFTRAELTLTDCVLRSNATIGGPGTVTGLVDTNGVPGNLDVGSAGLGGAVYVESGRFYASNTVFSFNRAEGGPGGSAAAGTSTAARVAHRLGNAFPASAPSATGGAGMGGALFAHDGSVALVRCVFEGNVVQGGKGGSGDLVAGGGGGGFGAGVYSQAARVDLESCSLRSNAANGGSGTGPSMGWIGEATADGGPGDGAGLYVLGGTLRLVNGSIVSNSCAGGTGSGAKNAGSGGPARGGGLLVRGGEVTVERSLFEGNEANGGLPGVAGRRPGKAGDGSGGAIAAMDGLLQIENVTLSGNAARGNDGYNGSLVGAVSAPPSASRGGALALFSSSESPPSQHPEVRLRFSTVTANRAIRSLFTRSGPFLPAPVTETNGIVDGGGLFNDGASLYLEGIICAGNISATNSDIGGTFTSGLPNLIQHPGTALGVLPHDLVGIDPRLGPLGAYGGPTPTHPLRSGSPAIDVIRESAGPAIDQRGMPRPVDAGWDLGAYEAGPRITEIRVSSTGQITIEFAGTTGMTPALEYSPDLAAWSPLGSHPEGSAFRDTVTAAARYYRLVAQPR